MGAGTMQLTMCSGGTGWGSGDPDALAMRQEAGDLVATVATGATGGARRMHWIARLALCSAMLVAYDADTPGDAAAAYWLERLENARRWRPYWGDANAMAQAGADVRAWVAAGAGDSSTSFDYAQDRPLRSTRNDGAEK
jgi:hypothetical protein